MRLEPKLNQYHLKVPLTVKLFSDRLVNVVIIGWYTVDKPDD